MALRNGIYIGDGDVRVQLEGVYVKPFGQLRLISDGSVPCDGSKSGFRV